MRTLVWFRGKDLRLADHEPLRLGAAGELVPVFVLDPYFFAPERAQRLPHRMQFLLQGLVALERNLAAKGTRLIVMAGRSTDVIPQLVAQWRIDVVRAYRWSEPLGRARDAKLAAALGAKLVLSEGETLTPPGTLRTGAGTPYAVFTQFAKAFMRTVAVAAPLPVPPRLPPLPADVAASLAGLAVAVPTLEALGMTSNSRLLVGGERAAHERLGAFLQAPWQAYATARDRMDVPGTSRLSADLKFGTVSVRRVWHEATRVMGETDAGERFRNELLWREFAYHTLWDRPALETDPFRAGFVGFPWLDDEAAWQAWCTGQTGYPIVDAAARQLLAEGYVHNRARMIAASFLTKHLLQSYRRGEAHYLRYLTDGDWAINNMGWQWSAGCGCDAQPYFRVFNPMTQGEKFDPDGAYVRRWVPELARLAAPQIHAPWEAAPLELRAAGVRLGETYPAPIVDHKLGRERFLAVAKAHLSGRQVAQRGKQRVEKN